jgi:hypothetical protein
MIFLSVEDRAASTNGGHVRSGNYDLWTGPVCESYSAGICFTQASGRNLSVDYAILRADAQICGHSCLPRSRRTRAIRKGATAGLQLPERGWPALIGVLIGDRACPDARLGPLTVFCLGRSVLRLVVLPDDSAGVVAVAPGATAARGVPGAAKCQGCCCRAAGCSAWRGAVMSSRIIAS